jgi:hypothetical protein
MIAHVLRRTRPEEAETDLAYWRARSMQERIDAALRIRNEHHGIHDETEQRLERVLVRIECR